MKIKEPTATKEPNSLLADYKINTICSSRTAMYKNT